MMSPLGGQNYTAAETTLQLMCLVQKVAHDRTGHALQVQLLYMLVIIATATCVGYLTPSRQRGPLLIWPPFLQLLPLIFLSFDPNRYFDRP